MTPEAGQTIECCEALLLILVKALVKRLCRVSQFLQCCSGVGHGGSASLQALDRIIAGWCIPHGHSAVHSQLGEIACRLFEGWPVLLLVRRQHKSGLQRREPRLTKCTQILGTGLPTLPTIGAVSLLRIDKRRARDCKRCCSSNDDFPHVPLECTSTWIIQSTKR